MAVHILRHIQLSLNMQLIYWFGDVKGPQTIEFITQSFVILEYKV